MSAGDNASSCWSLSRQRLELEEREWSRLPFSAGLYTPRTAYVPSEVGVRCGLFCPAGARAHGLPVSCAVERLILYEERYIHLTYI